MGVFNLFLLFISLVTVFCEEYVPVSLLSFPESSEPFPRVPALNRLSSNEFSDYLLKRVAKEKPLILLFVEENLSVEDFRWLDVDSNAVSGNFHKFGLSSKQSAFLPAVHEPYKAIQSLQKYGYHWNSYEKVGLTKSKASVLEIKFTEPDYLQDRPEMLLDHYSLINKTINEASKHIKNTIVIYTGHHASWIDAELSRFKREDKEENKSDTLIISDSNNVVRISTTNLTFTDKNKTVYEIKSLMAIPTIKTIKTDKEIILSARFLVSGKDDNDPLMAEFFLTSVEDNWWTFNKINVKLGNEKVDNMTSKNAIGGPSGYCYFCNPSVVFSTENGSLTFENFQAQPRVKGQSFGPAIHCIPFFSIVIWSGLIVVVILSLVLAWGIVMIMDINTNDRFDDPKGKTITISGGE